MRAALGFAVVVGACSPALDLTPTYAPPVALYEGTPRRADLGQLSYLGGVEIAYPDERFGGLSALHVDQDGTRFLAVSDSAYWVTGNFGWSEIDGIFSAGNITIEPMRSRTGDRLDGRAADSEAIANLGDGRIAVSFERDHRINTYAIGADWNVLDATGVAFTAPPGVESFANNGGMEALAYLPDGRLVAGVEDAFGGSYALWSLQGETWTRSSLIAEVDFGLTALDAHGEHIYALERYWQRDIGNRIRLVRFPITALDANAPIVPELLGTLQRDMTVDNFEGLSVFERNGQTMLLIVSDDNYSDQQRTLLMAFAVEE